MSGFFSGSFDPSWPHVVLLSVAIVASFAVAIGIVMESPHWSVANVLVVGGVAIEAVCTILLFGFDEGISQSQQAKIVAMQARPWTKSQFDALQAVKGKVSSVGIFPEKGCLECGMFAGDIELALHSAGVEIYRDDNLDWMSGTGIHVWLPRDPAPPSDKSNDPLVAALREAGLYPGFGLHNPSEWSLLVKNLHHFRSFHILPPDRHNGPSDHSGIRLSFHRAKRPTGQPVVCISKLAPNSDSAHSAV
jgi:hypothetical protein